MIVSDANPLDGRQAFVGQTPNFPARNSVLLDFGDKLAGETIQLRFRVGTDAAAGAAGWDIDNIRFTGITNTPFPRWRVDQSVCAETSGGSEGEPTTSDTASGGYSSSFDAGYGTDSAIDSTSAIDDDGCGCTREAPGRGGWLALLLLGLRRRRRA